MKLQLVSHSLALSGFQCPKFQDKAKTSNQRAVISGKYLSVSPFIET